MMREGSRKQRETTTYYTPLLREASRKVVSKKQLQDLSALHCEPYRTLFRYKRVTH